MMVSFLSFIYSLLLACCYLVAHIVGVSKLGGPFVQFSLNVKFDSFADNVSSSSIPLEPASLPLLLYTARIFLRIKDVLIIEGSFVPAEQARAAFLHLQQICPFTPFVIECRASGPALLQRYLARLDTTERHRSHFHNDVAFVQQHLQTILQGQFPRLQLEGQSIELDMTDLAHFDYNRLLSLLSTILGREH